MIRGVTLTLCVGMCVTSIVRINSVCGSLCVPGLFVLLNFFHTASALVSWHDKILFFINLLLVSHIVLTSYNDDV